MTRPLLCLGLCVLALGCGSSGAPADRHGPDTVEADDTERRNVHRVEDMLRGQVAGVEVYDTPSGLGIRIRGGNSFGASSPLFVIDGLPLEQGAEGVTTGLNPNDIESIRVLKNVADTALYGSRGANGVILITTRRPPTVRPDSTGG